MGSYCGLSARLARYRLELILRADSTGTNRDRFGDHGPYRLARDLTLFAATVSARGGQLDAVFPDLHDRRACA